MTEESQKTARAQPRVHADRVLAARTVTPRMRDRLWEMYVEAFADVATHAVGSQILERESFDQLVDDPETYKMIGVEGSEPVGMIMLTPSLHLIPGVNGASLVARYPDQHARAAVFYVPFAFVSARAKSLRLFAKLITAASQVAAVRDGVIVLDMCRFLESSGQARLVRRALRAFPGSEVAEIDAQVYYAATLPHPTDMSFDVALEALDLDDDDVVVLLPDAGSGDVVSDASR